MKPRIICHMLASLDGGLHPSRYTASPDGTRAEWSGLYEQIHGDLEGDAWIVGRVTMAEMSRVGAHPPTCTGPVERSLHVARTDALQYALAVDPSGRLHFAGAAGINVREARVPFVRSARRSTSSIRNNS